MKRAIIFIITTLHTISSSAQDPTTFDSLKIIEKVYLHTDRFFYYPGDDIWFKAYLINASHTLLSDNSSNLHVELISPDLKIITSRTVRLAGGLGNGDFHLAENLKSGRYQLRAYTNYMRNFSDQLFFYKEITIINSSESESHNINSDSNEYVENKLEINFFPEGGSLIENVTSIVAFKAVNAIGLGSDVTGTVFSSTGEMITKFKSSHNGMGSFSLLPSPGTRYYAIVKDQYNNEVKSEMPGSFKTGVAMTLTVKDSNKLMITIKTNTETFPQLLDHDLTLTVSARGILFKSAVFRMNYLTNYFLLPIDDLPNGIVMFTLTGLDDLPLCERLFFLQKNEDFKIKLETNTTVYRKRDPVSIKLSFSPNSEIQEEAFLSLAAIQTISNSSSRFPSTISSWFLLESDVRAPVEEASYYFDPSNPNRIEDLNLLLLTQGWRDFTWKYENLVYAPENGFKVSGRLRKMFKNKPLENSKVNVVIQQAESTLITTLPVDTSGRFKLEGLDFEGYARLIVSAIGENKNLQGYLLLDSLNYPPADVQENFGPTKLLRIHNKSLKENVQALIKDSDSKKTIRKKYTLSDTIEIEGVTVVGKKRDNPLPNNVLNSRLVYNKPDNELIITPELSTSYNSFAALIDGRFPGVYVGSKPKPGDGDSNIRIRGQLFQPLFMIDGMIVGWDQIFSLPVQVIERIDVLKSGASAAALGARGAGGVISVITRIGSQLTTYNPVYHSANIKVSGYDKQRIFYSPRHTTNLEKDYKPDLRTTLFWEPNIKLDSKRNLVLNYFNSDNSSSIDIIVEGITTSGIPISAKAEYYIR